MRLRDLNCDNVKNLNDIQINGTIDTSTKDTKMDSKLVACCQIEPNELKSMIGKYYTKTIKTKSFYQAICEFCKNKHNSSFLDELDGDTQWKKLYDHLSKKGFQKN